ncbi:MAG: RND family transporter [Deltaproteobacteria bacterium]|nr:RND family transporter [Deltaproteobacteria bacterium]
MLRFLSAFRAYLDFVLRHRGIVVAFFFALTAFWGSQLPVLRVEFDPDATLPQNHPYVQALHILETHFGEKNLIVIGLFPKDHNVFSPEFLTTLNRVTRRIRDLPGIMPSTYLSLASRMAKAVEGSGETLMVRPLIEGSLDAKEVRRRTFANPFYSGTIVAADGSAAAIIANFRMTPELPGWREIKDRVESTLAQESNGTFIVRLGGPIAVAAAASEMTERAAILFPIAVLVIGIIHYEAFRTLQGLVLPLVTALFAVIWSLGIMGLLRIPLDPFNTTTPILILAVAAGHAVQILKRYYEEYDRCGDSVEAVRTALLLVGPVMITAGVIAALSFFSLTVFATATVRNFGLLSGIGIISALAIELTIIPALRALLPAPRATDMAREAASGHLLEVWLSKVGRVVSRRPGVVTCCGLALVGVALALATRVHVDTSFRRQFPQDHPVRVADRALNAAFAGTSTLILLVEGTADGALESPAVLQAIADLQRFIETDPDVGKTTSIVDLVREMHRAVNGGDPAFAIVPANSDLINQYLLLYSMSGPEDLDSQLDPAHRSAAVRVFLHSDSTKHGQDLIARIRQQVERTFPPDIAVRYSGTVASDAALTEVMVRGKILNIIQIAAIIIVVSSLVLRSLMAGMLVVAPLAMAVIFNFGMMGLLDVPLDTVTAAIAALAVGIGADYAVYFLFRFREELQTSRTAELALISTLRTSGKAIIYVSSAIAGGYLVLCTSKLAIHVELGGMVSLAMLVSSLATMTLLPALALLVRPNFLFAVRRAANRRLTAKSDASLDDLLRTIPVEQPGEES